MGWGNFIFSVREKGRWIGQAMRSSPFLFIFAQIVILVVTAQLFIRFSLSKQTPANFPAITFCMAAEGLFFQFLNSYRGRSKMETIARSMSTRYIGSFPSHLKDIIEIAAGAQENLQIMVDCLDYGSFSAPPLHETLIRALEDASRGDKHRKVRVQILLSDDPAPITRSSPFFGRKLEELSENQEFGRCLAGYCEFNNITDRPATTAALDALLRNQQADVQRRLRKANIEMRRLHETVDKPGVFFWIADNREAVFLLEHDTERQGLAFRTLDAMLFGVFRETFQRSWTPLKSDPLEEKHPPAVAGA